MRIAYIDAFSGISGDMFLGALVDAGVPPRLLEETVTALDVGARLEVRRVDRSGISATKVDVWAGGEKDLPREEYWKQKEDLDKAAHAPSHGHTHDHGHSHHQHSHDESRAGAPAPHKHDHGHPLRGLKEIREIIAKAKISDSAKTRAVAIFEALADAEAKVHNSTRDAIHFHEVGAVDAIVDVVCAAVGSGALGVDEWVCSPLNLGSGTVKCQHGEFPIPAPAVVELLKDAPVFSSGIQAELVTPTGAAIVKVLAKRFEPIPGMKIEKIGYGAGSRDFQGHANVVRILVGESGPTKHAAEGSRATSDIEAPRETISVLEANLDDLNPQVFGYVMDRLLAEGALDVFGTPVQMKKNRPGMLLTVLCKPEHAAPLTRLIFTETTTLGVRMREERRAALVRRSVSVQTKWGEVRLKVANLNGAVANYAPEYEDCRRIAEAHHVPLKQVMQEATRLYLEQNG
ncbi:MAG TPA: nickel pincer cofactor biosynthesis protein LarC [Terriglobales bacterium]|nr:nickel pincer cofactor biosynthesis protein LarC [Terriglobales bacterium]